MKKIALSSLAVLLLAFVLAVPAFAMPAYPEPIEVDNGLGESVTVCLKGDEFFNFTTDEAGNLVERDADKTFRYVVAGENESYVLGGTVTDRAFFAIRDRGNKISSANLQKDKLQALRNEIYEANSVATFALTEGEGKTDPLADKTSSMMLGDIKTPQRGATIPLLMVLIDFEKTAETGTAYKCQFTPREWSDYIFGDSGIKSYYNEVSNGKFTYIPATQSNSGDNTAAGVIRITLPIDRPLRSADANFALGKYISTDGTEEYNILNDSSVFAYAFEALDEYIDFSAYDTSKDGYISPTELAFTFVVAGYEAASYACGVGDPAFWAHSWLINNGREYQAVVLDGVKLYKYTAMGELFDNTFDYAKEKNNDDNKAVHMGIGVVCHELGHDLGLPDLYDTSYSNLPMAVNDLSIMAGGSWGREGDEVPTSRPTQLDPWCKIQLGFFDSEKAESGTKSYTLNQSANPSAYSIIRIESARPGVYYLVENRQYAGFDASLESRYRMEYIPTEEEEPEAEKREPIISNETGGIVVWQIDENVLAECMEANKINATTDYGIMPVYLKNDIAFPFRNSRSMENKYTGISVDYSQDLTLGENPLVKLNGFSAASGAMTVNISAAERTATPTIGNATTIKNGSLKTLSLTLTNEAADFNNKTGFKLYADSKSTNQPEGVTLQPVFAENKWTLTLFAEDLPLGSYWISAQDEEKFESNRLRIKIDPTTETDYELSKTELSFGTVYEGYEQEPEIQHFTLTNRGSKPIEIVNLTEVVGRHFYYSYSGLKASNYGDEIEFGIYPMEKRPAGEYNDALTITIKYGDEETATELPPVKYSFRVLSLAQIIPDIPTNNIVGGVGSASIVVGTYTTENGTQTLTVNSGAVLSALSGENKNLVLPLKNAESGEFILNRDVLEAVAKLGGEISFETKLGSLALPAEALNLERLVCRRRGLWATV